jgi:hypothetical protein
MPAITSIGLDVAKSVFQVHGIGSRAGGLAPLAVTPARSSRNCPPNGEIYGEKAVVEQGLDTGFESA